MASPATAAQLVDALWAARSADELAKIRKRLTDDEEAFGLRMRELFDLAKAATDLSLTEVHRLLDHPAYEPRMAAMCILDFQARRQLDDDQRQARYATYLDRHDRITTWDMVDRAAPRVIGGALIGRPVDPLLDLAVSGDALRRRTAITAPLHFIRHGGEVDLDPLDEDDQHWLREQIRVHEELTGSTVAARLLAAWHGEVRRFKKVMPRDYKRVLEASRLAEEEGRDVDEAIMASARG